MAKILAVFESTVEEIHREDSGSALITDISLAGKEEADCGPFIRLQSWCEYPHKGAHHPAWLAKGKRLRVTVEEV